MGNRKLCYLAESRGGLRGARERQNLWAIQPQAGSMSLPLRTITGPGRDDTDTGERRWERKTDKPG